MIITKKMLWITMAVLSFLLAIGTFYPPYFLAFGILLMCSIIGRK